MSLVADSPVNSSSSDDFAAFLETELDSTSDTSPALEDEDDVYQSNKERIKRRKMEVSGGGIDACGSASHEAALPPLLEASVKEDICTHPGIICGMCIRCGQKMDNQSGVAFGYMGKDLRLESYEITRLRKKDLTYLLSQKKLYLVLDLDHTLLNSTRFLDITPEEEYLRSDAHILEDELRGSLFILQSMHLLTKLRPYVHSFLKEASTLFEMYIYTMGERAYALEMAKLLDPENKYFDSRVIAQGDSSQRHQKGLDVVLGQEAAVLILDDTEAVWGKHKENLILMERYHFFASSCRQFGFSCKSLSELKSDESEAEGALSTILEVLKRIHSMFFDMEIGENLTDRDVRQVLSTVRKEVLRGCKVVFSRVFPTKFPADSHHLWKMAERMGAVCLAEVDPSVTHVITTDVGTEKSRWAVQENKFLVHPRWIEASNYLWRKQSEENFPVKDTKSQ